MRAAVDPIGNVAAEPAELAHQPSPGDGDGEQRAEQDDGVDRLAALLRPVVVGEVQPERELVEGQRGAGAVQ